MPLSYKHHIVTLFSFFYCLCNQFIVFGQNPSALELNLLRVTSINKIDKNATLGDIQVDLKYTKGYTVVLQMRTAQEAEFKNIATANDGVGQEVLLKTFFIPDLEINKIIYCFRAIIIDQNQNQRNSETLCSIPFEIIKPSRPEEKPTLRIATYQPQAAGSYRPRIILECDSFIGCESTEEDFVTANKANAFFEDKLLNRPVKCGEIKNISIEIEIGNIKAVSNKKEYEGFTKDQPSTIEKNDAYATITNGKVELNWKNSETNNLNYIAEKQYFLSRAEGANGSFTRLPNTAELERKKGDTKKVWQYVDMNSTPTKNQYRYQISYEDFCGNISDPIEIATIYLESDNKLFLNWSDFYSNRTDFYMIEGMSKEELPGQYIDGQFGPSVHSHKPTKITNFYRLEAKLSNGTKVYSNYTPFGGRLRVDAPMIFTPDGDGTNDDFRLMCSAINYFDMVIYDKNGVLMYKSNNYDEHEQEGNGWDGTFLDTFKPAPEGTYVYWVKIKNSIGKELEKRGSFLLVRNKK